MAQTNWISITDYASKYKVSVSTIRRRIRSEGIDFELNDGKYFIQDEPLSLKSPGRKLREVNKKSTHNKLNFDYGDKSNQESSNANDLTEFQVPKELSHIVNSQIDAKAMSQPIFSSAQRILEEIKKSYSNVLHEKEEQIFQLKTQIADLQTLVRVLETELSKK